MNWESLSREKRGLKGDMITLYKYLQGYNIEDRDQLFSSVNEARTRTNGLTLKKGKCEIRFKKTPIKNINAIEQADKGRCQIIMLLRARF